MATKTAKSFFNGDAEKMFTVYSNKVLENNPIDFQNAVILRTKTKTVQFNMLVVTGYSENEKFSLWKKLFQLVRVVQWEIRELNEENRSIRSIFASLNGVRIQFFFKGKAIVDTNESDLSMLDKGNLGLAVSKSVMKSYKTLKDVKDDAFLDAKAAFDALGLRDKIIVTLNAEETEKSVKAEKPGKPGKARKPGKDSNTKGKVSESSKNFQKSDKGNQNLVTDTVEKPKISVAA